MKPSTFIKGLFLFYLGLAIAVATQAQIKQTRSVEAVSVKDFLAKLKADPPHEIVTGNQSADADSVVSALAYAYYSYLQGKPIVPLVNIPRDELKLRKDIVLLLSKHNVDENDLFFTDDLTTLVPSLGQINLHLVDHNQLEGLPLNDLSSKFNVVLIIDHHEDNGLYKDASPRIITTAGSCSLLIWQYWLKQLGATAQQEEIVELLTAPLLLDTSNMQKDFQLVDTDAYNAYSKILSGDYSMSSYQGSFYSELKDAKKDLSGFLFFDILRKDYKQTEINGLQFGFSAVKKSFAWLDDKFSNEKIDKAFGNMEDEYKLDFIVILTNDDDRELGIYSPTGKTINLDYAVQQLQLKKLNDGTKISDMKLYTQGNADASRKQIIPIFKETVEQHQWWLYKRYVHDIEPLFETLSSPTWWREPVNKRWNKTVIL